MSGKEEKGQKKDGESTAKVIPDEPAALQELEDRLMDRLLRKVRKESGSEELGELECVDTASAGKSWVPATASKPTEKHLDQGSFLFLIR